MEYPYFKGLEADRYSFYRVPKALVKADLFQKMSGDAKLLYAVLLDRMSLSIKNGWQDKHGNAYIICTIEEVMDSIHCARQKAVKLLDELEQEFRLIERRRQGLGKPNLLYVKDLYGCVNNVPKKPRRIGGRWSVLDRLHIKQAERRQKDNTPQQEQERSRKS